MSRQSRPLLGLAAIAIVAAGVGTYLVRAHATGLTGVQWVQIGPAPLQINVNQNYQGTGPDSGEVVDMAIDPRGTTDSTIYIVAGSGGIWKSTDSGNSWTPKSDSLLSLSTGAVALDPGNPSIVYAGTDNPYVGGDCPACNFEAVGIYKSLDGGDTWTLLPSSPSGVGILRIVMPATGVLLAATTGGLYRSLDGGNTFSQLPVIPSQPGDLTDDIHLDTQNPTTVRVSVDGNGIFVSNSDVTAATPPTFTNLWTASNGSPLQNPVIPGGTIGYISFSQSTTGGLNPAGQTIYASVQNDSPTQTPPSNFLGLWVSTNGGSTWSNLPGANAAGAADGSKGCQCGYDQTIAVDPTTDQTVYLGFQEVWESTNGGTSFSASAITSGQVHWDQHVFLFSPHDPTGQTLYTGSDGGVATTTNGGTTWNNINGTTSFSNGGIASNLIYKMDIGRGSSANRQWTYAGFQDTGNAQFGAGYTGNTWQLGQDGDGGPMTVDPCNALHAITSDDGGYNQTTTGGGSPSYWSGTVTVSPAPTAPKFAVNGSAYAFDQTCDNTVYAGLNIPDTDQYPPPPPTPPPLVPTIYGLYQSTDNGNTYAQVLPLTKATQVSAIATVKIDPNTVWIGRNDGSLAFSSNALLGTSSTWTVIPDPGPHQQVQGIAIDPNSANTVFVAYPGINGTSPSQHIFMTINSGANWTDITGTGADSLPDLPFHTIAIDPSTSSTPRTIIVGGDGGVFETTDDGVSWQVLGVGLPTVGVESVALDSSVSPSLLRIGTYGRGAFELDPPTGPLLTTNSTFNFGTLCPGQTPTEVLQLFNVGTSDLTISSISLTATSPDFAISGPGFPVTISPNAEVDFTIQYTPTLANEGITETAIFQIVSNSVVDPSQNVTYTATVGQPNGSTVIASGGAFGNVCGGALADLNLTIANSGTCPLLISNITSSDANFLAPSTLVYPLSVQAGNSLVAPLVFEPLSGGAKSGTITVDSSNNPSGNMNVSVTGTAPPGKITWSGSGVFGTSVCSGGTGVTQTLQVDNTGACNLNVASAALTGCSSAFTLVNPAEFPATISADSGLGVGVNFSPTTQGLQSCNLTIDSNDPATPVLTVPLSGEEGNGKVNVTGSGNFGTAVCAGTSPTQTLTINNTGPCNLNVASAVLTGCSGDFTRVNPTEFPATISADSGLGVGIQFSPTSQGLQSCSLTIDSNDPSNPAVVFPLSGEEGNGKILVTGSGNFGTVCGGKAPPQTLKVNNTGLCNLIVTSAVISCPDFTLVNPSEFPATISPDSELDIGVNFTPTSAGPKSCTLTINSNDPSNPVVVIPLNATTPLGSAELTFPAGLTFPPTVIQQEAACPLGLGVPVTDGGVCPVQMNSVTLTQSSTAPPGLDYSLTGLPGLPVTLAPGDQLGDGDLDVVFEPFTLARESTGNVNFTFVNDPITGATATTAVPFCGEAVDRGVRVLVTLGGVPVSTVKKISLQNAYGPEQPEGDEHTIQSIKNATLQTVTGVAPCPSFEFQAEFGGVSNPRQLKLGDYRVKVYLKVGKKLEHKAVRFTMDECSFTPNIVVAF